MLNELLHKYLYKQLSKNESERLKQWIETTNTTEIENALSEQWEKHTIREPRNKTAYHVVTQYLQSLISQKTSQRLSFIRYAIRIAAMLLFPLLIAGGVYYFTKQHDYNIYAATQYRMETGKGERATLTLPDGTKVSLNSESTFTYPASFGKTDRYVQLEGEAYFEVIHNNELPFIVQAKQVNVRVLGTIFNVHAYPADRWIETTLVEGNVELHDISNPGNRITLLPNQTARFDVTTGQFKRNTVEQRLATAWKRGEIIFRSAPWTSVIHKIEKYYGVTIQQDERSIPTEQFTGSFLHEDVNEVLRNLQIHYQFSYTKTGNQIRIIFK